MRVTQGLRRSSFLFSDRTATICDDRRTTWSQLANRVARLAGGLKELGAKPGDRIGILAANSDYYIEAYYAILWAGCVAVPFNTRWAPAEIAYAFEDSQPAILIFDQSFRNAAEEFAGRAKTVCMDASDTEPNFETLIASASPLEDSSGSGHGLAGIFYTGGTTGRAKGVMLSHANLTVNFLGLQSVAPYDAETVFLHTPPMFHLADASCLFGLTMLGATHVVLPGFEPASTTAAIREHKVTALVLVPTMIGMLCEYVRQNPADLSGIRRLTYGASSISETVLEEAMTLFTNAEFCQGYGQTELSPIVTTLTHSNHTQERLASAGQPIPGVDIRIIDANLSDVAPGKVGEVAVRGPGVMLGYWNLPDVTQETIVDGWLRTGDAGRLDDNGFLYLVDRVKDMIVSGGENIYSVEVENAILQHPDVLQCAVIGIPSPKWGEEVHAVVYHREGASVTADDLLAHCAPLIAKYKQPKSFDLRSTPLPLSGVGKILKTALREPYWKNAQRRIS